MPSITPNPSGDDLSSYSNTREWLQQRHRHQLALLDRFLLELRRGKLAQSRRDNAIENNSNGGGSTGNNYFLSQDRRIVTHRTVDLLRHLIGGTKWKSPAQLLSLLRGVGCELQAAGGSREPAIGNVVRRIMAAVREEAAASEVKATKATTAGAASTPGGRLSLQSMLWALPQHVRSTSSTGRTLGDRQESFADGDIESEYPTSYYAEKIGSDFKSSIMEAIDEIMNELEDLHKSINEQAVNHIHSGEIILTSGRSKTVELFLKAAAAKKRDFQVMVAEGAPYNGGHDMAKSLSSAGIPTTVIPDAAVFAVMARVNKVVLPAHAVLANGGLVASTGSNLVALAAHHNSVPVVCTTGLFKLCPVFPHEGQDTLNDLVSPSLVIEYAEMNEQSLGNVEFVNPVHDFVRPEHIDLFITNVGSFQPSFIYRLLAEYYHADDWNCFD